jgi:hypothetical protein
MSVNDTHNLDSTVAVRSPSTKMAGVFVLYQTDVRELDSTLTVAKLDASDLSSSMSVKALREKDFNSTLTVIYRNNDYLSATFDVVGSKNLDSYLDVRVNNRMSGVFELLPAPRVQKSIVSSEDSTTRSRVDLMTINYGDNQRMMTGQGSTTDGIETLESFIKWNNLNNTLIDMSMLEIAKLRLYYTGDFVIGTNLELHYPNTNWSEFGITHANKPTSTGMYTSDYTINTQERYIEFDVLTLLKSWLNGSRVNLGLIVRSNDDHSTSFYAREGRFKPSLNVKYVTNRVFSLGRAELPSHMFIWSVGNKDMDSTLFIKSDYGWDYLNSTLYVHTVNEQLIEQLDGTLTVSRPDQTSWMRVVRADKSEINASISIQMKSETKLDSKIIISRPDQHAIFTVDPNISLKSTIAVSRWVDNDLEACMYVTRPDVLGTMYIRKSDTMDATMQIVVNTSKELESMILITRPDIIAHLYSRAIGKSELEGFLNARLTREHDQEATLYVSRRQIDANLYVKHRDELTSSITVVRSEDDDFKSFLHVSRRQIDADLYVKHRDELTSMITIVQSEDQDNWSILYVNRREIEAHLYIRYRDDLNASITVIRSENDDKDSLIHITRPDIIGYLYSRVTGRSEQDSLIKVARWEVDDKFESFFNTSNPDLQSTLKVMYISDIESSVSVRRSENHDQDSLLYITRREIIGHLYVRAYGESDLDSSIEVPHYDRLDSTLMVHKISEIEGTMIVKATSEYPANITVTNPALWAFLYPRAIGYGDLTARATFRSKDASDINSRLVINGKFGAYYFII